MPESGLRSVVEDRRINAVLAWIAVGVLAVTGITETMTGSPVRGLFAFTAAGIAAIPPIAFRAPEAMLPWEVLGLAALPALSQAFLVGETVGGVTLTGRITAYIGVASVALVIAVEADVFTSVRMNESFAVLFVTVTTIATAGVWAVVRWLSDRLLGTAFLLNGRPEAVIETALMWDFVAATVAGIGAGVLFVVYFRRRRSTTVALDDVEGTVS